MQLVIINVLYFRIKMDFFVSSCVEYGRVILIGMTCACVDVMLLSFQKTEAAWLSRGSAPAQQWGAARP